MYEEFSDIHNHVLSNACASRGPWLCWFAAWPRMVRQLGCGTCWYVLSQVPFLSWTCWFGQSKKPHVCSSPTCLKPRCIGVKGGVWFRKRVLVRELAHKHCLLSRLYYISHLWNEHIERLQVQSVPRLIWITIQTNNLRFKKVYIAQKFHPVYHLWKANEVLLVLYISCSLLLMSWLRQFTRIHG